MLDTDRNLILSVHILTVEGREIRAAIDYGTFGDFELPKHIELQFEASSADSNEVKEFIPFTQKEKRVAGKVEITYSNYKVNLGFSDDIFKETQPHQ